MNVAEVLARELARPLVERELVAIGAATDPYQPAEGRYRLTRACIEVLGRGARPVRIITRGPLIVRDLDVLRRRRAAPSVLVTFSVPTLDDEVWRRDRAGDGAAAAAPAGARAARRRRDRRERRHGADPPGLSDRPEQLADVVSAAREAGATGVWANVLYLRPGTRSTSSRRSRATGRSSSTATSGCTRGGAYLPQARPTPVREQVRSSRASTASATAGRRRWSRRRSRSSSR